MPATPAIETKAAWIPAHFHASAASCVSKTDSGSSIAEDPVVEEDVRDGEEERAASPRRG